MFNAALNDLTDGLRRYELWSYLAIQEVRQRYRRSILGPFWITISMMIFIIIIGPLYSKLFNQDSGEYYLSLTIGFVVWNLISSTINDFTQVFISSEQFIKQVKLPYSIYLFKVILRNLFIFTHNFVVILAVYIFFTNHHSANWVFFFIGLFLLILNFLWIGIILALLCTRFRDLNQLTANLIQISFFITPIIWKPEVLGSKYWILNYNIFFHLVEIIRLPLTNPSQFLYHLSISLFIFMCGFAFSLYFLNKYINRISFWI